MKNGLQMQTEKVMEAIETGTRRRIPGQSGAAGVGKGVAETITFPTT